MAQFIQGGADAFNALAFGQVHPNTSSFIDNVMSRPMQVTSEIGRSFMEMAHQTYDRVRNSDTARIMAAVRRQFSTRWDEDVIKSLQTLDGIQAPPMVMKRWIMASPDIRELYHNQACDGYSGDYVDAQPGKIGEEHYDYRRVMDGIVQENEDGWFFDEYIEDTIEGDRELTAEDQSAILVTWDAAKTMLTKGQSDPTSRWNAFL